MSKETDHFLNMEDSVKLKSSHIGTLLTDTKTYIQIFSVIFCVDIFIFLKLLEKILLKLLNVFIQHF